MKRKLLIEKRDGKIRTYLIEDDEIVEIHSSPASGGREDCYRLGDIYIGKVSNIVPNIGAAFVEIGKDVNCYYDIKDTDTAIFTRKSGKKPLCIGDELVVQIRREASGKKAPTVTSNLSFTGRYAVLTHGNTRIGVSSKIPKALRETYKNELGSFQNDDFGIIVRTNAKEAPMQDVTDEISALKDEYHSLTRAAQTRVCFTCLKSAPPSYIADLKNVYMDGMEAVIVGDRDLYTRIRLFFQSELPERLGLLKLYDNPDFPLDKLYGTQAVLDKALMERAWLKTGGYLIIQPTEALTVIDVNSGKNTSKKDSEEGALRVNLEAARESARQIRLRNLSGIILVDFINQKKEENMQKLLREFRYCLAQDPVQTTLVDMTALGLVEITRRKIRRSLYEEERQ